jgi:hypothetical protein
MSSSSTSPPDLAGMPGVTPRAELPELLAREFPAAP